MAINITASVQLLLKIIFSVKKTYLKAIIYIANLLFFICFKRYCAICERSYHT